MADIKNFVIQYWKDVAEQNAVQLKKYFMPQANIKWHNSNELFTVDEFIIANCEYPGKWKGEVERIESNGRVVITVVKVSSLDHDISFHVTSFFEFEEDKIRELDEYWGDDGEAPQWRKEKKLGRLIVMGKENNPDS